MAKRDYLQNLMRDLESHTEVRRFGSGWLSGFFGLLFAISGFFMVIALRFPDWFATPEAFMHKSYDEKKAMIEELRGPISMEMVLQEINRYADSEFRYTDKSDDAAVSDIIRRERQREKAVREIETMKAEGRW